MSFKSLPTAGRLGVLALFAFSLAAAPTAFLLIWLNLLTPVAAILVAVLAGLMAAAMIVAWRAGADPSVTAAPVEVPRCEIEAPNGIVLLAAQAAKLQRLCRTIRQIGGNAPRSAAATVVADAGGGSAAEPGQAEPEAEAEARAQDVGVEAERAGAKTPSEPAPSGAVEEVCVDAAMREMETIAATVDRAARQIKQLQGELHRASSIATVIGEVASQTDFLAFNATIEAARAGTRGMGLAVAAQAVRDLARSTSEATERIEKTILTIQLEAGGAESAIAQVGRQVRRSVELVQGSAEGERDGVGRVEDGRAGQAGSASIAEQMEQIAQIVQGSTASMQTAAAATVELERMAKALNESISRFRG